jgi:hypothetical protein
MGVNDKHSPKGSIQGEEQTSRKDLVFKWRLCLKVWFIDFSRELVRNAGSLRVGGQPGLHSETLFPKKQNKQTRKRNA